MNRKKVVGIIIFGWIICSLVVFLYFSGQNILWLSLGENTLRIFLLFIFLLVNTALGKKIFGWSKFKADSVLESYLFEFAIGLGIFTYIVIGLGLVGLLYRWVIDITLLGIFIFTYPQIKNIFHTAYSKLKNYFGQKKNLLNINTLLIIILFIQLIISLSGASVLPESYDDLGEHLAISKEWINLHRLAPVPYINYAQWGGPFNIGILYGVGMLIKDVILSKLIHFAFGVLIAISIYAFGKKYFSKRVGLLSAVIFYTIPVVVWNSTTAYIDLGVTFYLFLAFYAFINWSISQKRSWLIISGIISGLGLGSKYVALLGLAILSIGVLIDGWVRKKEKFLPVIKNFLLFTILGILMGSFWYIRAYFMMGGQLPYGLQNLRWSLKRLGISGIISSPAYAFDLNLSKKVVTLPWEMSMHPGRFHGPASLGIIFLAILPFLIFLRRVRKNLLMKFILYYSVIFYFFWAIFGPLKRYLIPVLPLFSLMVAYVIETISTSHKNLKIFLYSLVFFTFIFNIVYLAPEGLNKVYERLLVLSGMKSQEEYILKNEETYRVFKYVNENLPSDAKIFILSEPKNFYCNRKYATVFFKEGKPLNYSPLKEEEILAEFKQAGFTHFITNEYLLGLGYGRYLWNKFSEEFKKNHFKVVYNHYPFVVYKIIYY